MTMKPRSEFELAPQDRVDRLAQQVTRVLGVLGFPGSLVTDESFVTDFCDFTMTREQRAAHLRRVSTKLGVRVTADDYLWQVAERMQALDRMD